MNRSESIRNIARVIKNETQAGANTAGRIGGAFETVADVIDGIEVGSGSSTGGGSNSVSIVQGEGQSMSAVMSQKAVSDALQDLRARCSGGSTPPSGGDVVPARSKEIFNVDAEYPLSGEYYTHVKAVSKVPMELRKRGFILVYAASKDEVVMEQFIGETWSDDESLWHRLNARGIGENEKRIFSWQDGDSVKGVFDLGTDSKGRGVTGTEIRAKDFYVSNRRVYIGLECNDKSIFSIMVNGSPVTINVPGRYFNYGGKNVGFDRDLFVGGVNHCAVEVIIKNNVRHVVIYGLQTSRKASLKLSEDGTTVVPVSLKTSKSNDVFVNKWQCYVPCSIDVLFCGDWVTNGLWQSVTFMNRFAQATGLTVAAMYNDGLKSFYNSGLSMVGLLNPRYAVLTFGHGSMDVDAATLSKCEGVCTRYGVKMVVNHIPMIAKGGNEISNTMKQNAEIEKFLQKSKIKESARFDIATSKGGEPNNGFDATLYTDGNPNTKGHDLMANRLFMDVPFWSTDKGFGG